jgi:anti-sigma factor RsiW
MMKKSNCINRKAVQDWELEAYADGEALPHVAEHLERCPACRAWLEERVAFERRLRSLLYRLDCPSPDLLRDYHWDYLPSDERRQVETHLDACPHCAAELADLVEFVAVDEEKPTSTLLARARQAAEQVRLVVAQLASPGLSPAPVLRGETREVLLFEAGDVALSVNLEQEDTGAYTLFGQVLSPEPILPGGSYARLTAREDGMMSVQTLLDANGGFALPVLHPGVYQLVVHLPEQRIVAPTLALKAEL